MRKTLLFAVVLLLTLTLPAVSMAGWPDRYYLRKVTFDGDIEVTEGHATLEVYEHAQKIVIEMDHGAINLTFQDKAGDDVWNDFADLSQNWTIEYADMPYDYFGRLYIRIHLKDGVARIIYRFGRITEEGRYKSFFKYHLEGSGEWSDAYRNITCFEESFTIYELSWQGRRNVRDFIKRWTGSLTFTIKIEEV